MLSVAWRIPGNLVQTSVFGFQPPQNVGVSGGDEGISYFNLLM